MSKEVEETIKRLVLHKEGAQLSGGTTCIVNKADLEKVLNYIKELENGINPSYEETIMELEKQLFDSTPKEVIREKIEELEKVKKEAKKLLYEAVDKENFEDINEINIELQTVEIITDYLNYKILGGEKDGKNNKNNCSR